MEHRNRRYQKGHKQRHEEIARKGTDSCGRGNSETLNGKTTGELPDGTLEDIKRDTDE